MGSVGDFKVTGRRTQEVCAGCGRAGWSRRAVSRPEVGMGDLAQCHGCGGYGPITLDKGSVAFYDRLIKAREKAKAEARVPKVGERLTKHDRVQPMSPKDRYPSAEECGWCGLWFVSGSGDHKVCSPCVEIEAEHRARRERREAEVAADPNDPKGKEPCQWGGCGHARAEHRDDGRCYAFQANDYGQMTCRCGVFVPPKPKAEAPVVRLLSCRHSMQSHYIDKATKIMGCTDCDDERKAAGASGG